MIQIQRVSRAQTLNGNKLITVFTQSLMALINRL